MVATVKLSFEGWMQMNYLLYACPRLNAWDTCKNQRL